MSKSNLEFHHLDWLGMRWNKIKRRPRKETESSRIQQTWLIMLCQNKIQLNKNGEVCFHHASAQKSVGIGHISPDVNNLCSLPPSHLPAPPHSCPECQEYTKYTLNGRKEDPQKDKLEASGLSTKPLLSYGHLFLIPVQSKWPAAWECVLKLYPVMPVPVFLNLYSVLKHRASKNSLLGSRVYSNILPGVQSPCFRRSVSSLQPAQMG